MSSVSRTEDGLFTFACPHCQGTVQVAETDLHCRIFRHGIFKHHPQQIPIPPHSSQAECERWVLNNEILGCGKPFRLSEENPPLHVLICDYI